VLRGSTRSQTIETIETIETKQPAVYVSLKRTETNTVSIHPWSVLYITRLRLLVSTCLRLTRGTAAWGRRLPLAGNDGSLLKACFAVHVFSRVDPSTHPMYPTTPTTNR
jgi:hypothetical protein